MQINQQDQGRTVTGLQMPMCSRGFRSGYAFAIVDGVKLKLHTSQSDRTDYNEHSRDVERMFLEGKGEPV